MKLRIMKISSTICCLLMIVMVFAVANAEASPYTLEAAVSETLDLWRTNRVNQLYDRLANRGSTSRDQFKDQVGGTSIIPACCWKKMDNFRVLDENETEAAVAVNIGFEVTSTVEDERMSTGVSTTTSVEYLTGEFVLINEEGVWKMQMNDFFNLWKAAGWRPRTR